MAASFDCANCGDHTAQRYLCKPCRKDLNPNTQGGKVWTCMYPGGGDDLFVDTWPNLEHANAAAIDMIGSGHAVSGAVLIGNTLHAEYGSTIIVNTYYKQGAK